LAEALVRGILSLSRIELEKRHGCLPDSPLAIVGYGTLGAAELGYTSDLDLVFLFRAGKSTSDGLRPLPPEQYHTRLARRVLSFLTAPTASGRLYETDMRLRPNGRSGLLVSSLSAFADYQSDSAWTWEWQALTRARWVAGDSGVGVEFSAVRRDVLRRPRDRNAVLQDIHDMRARIRTTAESEKTRRPDPYKHNPGGLVDIEFIAQYGTLVHASGDSRLLNPTDTIGQLETLGECGFLSENERQLLVSTHEKMTRGRHLSRLRRQTPNSNAPIMPGDEQVAQLFDRIFSAADR
jgi:glutamate-ammonia-ligase adenylyltransferase